MFVVLVVQYKLVNLDSTPLTKFTDVSLETAGFLSGLGYDTTVFARSNVLNKFDKVHYFYSAVFRDVTC